MIACRCPRMPARPSSITSGMDAEDVAHPVRLPQGAVSAVRQCGDPEYGAARGIQGDRPQATAEVYRLASAAGTASRPTCCTRAPRSTRSAMCCGIARAHRRPSTPSTMWKGCARLRARGRLREVAHDDASVATSRRLPRSPPQPRLRPSLRRARAAGLHRLRRSMKEPITSRSICSCVGRPRSAGPTTIPGRTGSGMVRAFASWLKGYDDRTEVPPPGLIPGKWHRSRPYIYSEKEVATVVARAAKLPVAVWPAAVGPAPPCSGSSPSPDCASTRP